MKKANILIIDDEPINRAILREMLKDEYEVFETDDGRDGFEILKRRSPQIHMVLLDLNMPKFSGFDTLKLIKCYNLINEVPIIIISADSSPESITEAYRLGAIDYLSKPFVKGIVKNVIKNTLVLAGSKYYDSVTGGFNHQGFLLEAEALLMNVEKKSDYALLYFNIKNFKAVNEIFGSAGGDKLLKHIYDKLDKCQMKPELVSRIHADHFVYLIKKDQLLLDRMVKEMNLTWNYNGNNLSIFLRCGVYYLEDVKTLNVSSIIDKAKLAMSSIVDEFSSPYGVFNEDMKNQYLMSALILSEFQKAIACKEFQVYYQPIVDINNGRVISCEALIRWIHPTRGVVSPGFFIPALENGGFISDLDNFVINQVYADINERLMQNKEAVPISINLSWVDFYDDKLKKNIVERINAIDHLNPYIRFEATETSLKALGNEKAMSFIPSLRSKGVKILIDDFGSGYSSLDTLCKYNFDILKIDMSIVKQITKLNSIRAIIRHIIEMCHEIDIKVIAEGVETDEQLDYLKKCGCDYIQGYYFSKPLPKEEFIKYLEEHNN